MHHTFNTDVVKISFDCDTSKYETMVSVMFALLNAMSKYLNMVEKTVADCVMATNQTYVDSLKQEGKFDADAQRVAFNKTLNAVLAILTDDAKNYLTQIFGDLNIYLTNLIESQVKINKM